MDVLSEEELNELKTNYLNIGFEFVNCKENHNDNEVDLEHIAYDSHDNIVESDSSEEKYLDL